jgi:flagellar protein FliO/FliZ
MIRHRLPAALAAVATCMLLPAATWAADGTKTTPAKGEDTPISVPADDGGAAASASSSGNIIRTFVGLAIVLAVIYGLYWVLRQIKASREEATKGEGLATVASIGLGPNRSLHLVRAGADYILVGVGEHAITPIRTYTEAEAVVAGLVPDPSAAGDDAETSPSPALAIAGIPGLLRRLAAAGGAPGAAPAGRPDQLTVQALLGALREKTVRS